VIFPVGHLHKPEVRRLAKDSGLHTAGKKESMGLCFVGKRDFSRSFLQDYLKMQPGPIVDLAGKQLGAHTALWRFTIGQRARLSGSPQALYVVSKDASTNTIVVAPGHDHPALYADHFYAEAPSWLAGVSFPLRCRFVTRYHGREGTCTVHQVHASDLSSIAGIGTGATPSASSESGVWLRIDSSDPHRSPVPGQVVCFYDLEGKQCLGGAIIAHSGPSLWHQGRGVPAECMELPRLRQHSLVSV